VKWLFRKCGGHEASLSLLAAGLLAEPERTKLEAHLVRCPACRTKLAEWQRLARDLADTGRRLPESEAPASLSRRWMTAVRESAAHSRGERTTARPSDSLVFGWLTGQRLAWGSLTAIWVLVLFFRFAAPDAPKPASLAFSPPSLREVLLALKVEGREMRQRADAGSPSRERQSPPDAPPPRSQLYPAIPAFLEVT
jgi:hypothetical protein